MRYKKNTFRLPELMQNPDPYVGKEITITGIVHRVWKDVAQWDYYLADYQLQSLDVLPHERLNLNWIVSPPEVDSSEKNQIFQQLEELITANVSIGKAKYAKRTHRYMSTSLYGREIETTLYYGSLSDHFNYHRRRDHFRHLTYLFENTDVESWKSIENPFIDVDIETQALELYRRLIYKRPSFGFPEIATRTDRNSPYSCWLEGKVTGVFEQHDEDFVLTGAWKAIVPTHESIAHVVVSNQLDYLDNFNGSPAIPVKQVLQEPQNYYGQEITVRGLFTSDFVHFGDDLKYARIVPNRLYYEFRSKWDHRVSLHLKMSNVTDFLFRFDQNVPGGGPRTLSSNRNCVEVRITGTLMPPENEHSLIILDNITDLVSIHEGLIHHWKPEMLRWDYSHIRQRYLNEIREL